MQFARDARARALVLLERKEAPERAFAVAQMWLSLAVIEDQLAIWASQIELETS
jgi:hypothetical protein